MIEKSCICLIQLFLFYTFLIVLVGQLPEGEERCLGDVHHLVPVETFAVVGRQMVIRMCIGVIPDDRNTELCKGTVVATTHRVVPCAVVRFQLQSVCFDVLLQPVAKCLVSSSIEIYEMLWLGMDLINDPKMKFVVMSFDENTGLSEHAAPGEALIFALDGQGIIGYEGKEYLIKAGENFKFAKNGKHFVKADGKVKMALLMTLE